MARQLILFRDTMIDYLFISHDHYDHLDYETILKLNPKTGKVICGLGVGSHFEAWVTAKRKSLKKNGMIPLI